MSSTTITPTASGSKLKRAVVVLVLASAAVAPAWWLWQDQGSGTSTIDPPAAPAATAVEHAAAPRLSAASEAAALQLSPQEADRQQAEAAAIVASKVVIKPLTGPVTERPDFVSMLEWVALRQVAEQKGAAGGDSQAELTRLVNHLRYMKLLELWRSMAGQPQQTADRRALAEQLLDEIPARVARREMGEAEARQLQGMLVADLVTDPQQRADRLQREAARVVPPAAP